MTTMLITGANRGLGLAMARHATERGHTVIGAARDPDHADELQQVASGVEQLDIESRESIENLARRLKGRAVDVLINNAGVFPHACDDINDFDPEAFERAMRVNTLGPIMVTRALMPNLAGSKRRLNVSISSVMGSIAEVSRGQTGSLGYRVSKAALNMANAVIAHQLRDKGITSVVIHPGWVRTDMGGGQAPLAPDEAAGSILDTIEGLGAQDTGRFIDYRRQPLPW